jgi:hypothetical protein
MQGELESYRQQALSLRQRKEQRWEANKALLMTKISRQAAAHVRG